MLVLKVHCLATSSAAPLPLLRVWPGVAQHAAQRRPRSCAMAAVICQHQACMHLAPTAGRWAEGSGRRLGSRTRTRTANQ